MYSIDSLKTLIGKDDVPNGLLILLIEHATQKAIDFTHNTNTDEYQHIIIEMAVYDFNRLDSQGLISENYSGVSFQYLEDYPEPILKSLRSHRRLRVVRS